MTNYISRKEIERFMMGNLSSLKLPDQLDTSRKYHIKGSNGYDYLLKVSHSNVLIVHSPQLYVSSNISTGGRVSYSLFTRDNHKDKSRPDHDLFAGRFYDASLLYFANLGHNIVAICSIWGEGTKSFYQYQENIRRGKHFEAAVFSAWGGMKASENGFKNVEANTGTDINQSYYDLIFTR